MGPRSIRRIASVVWSSFLMLTLVSFMASCGGDDERDAKPADEPAGPQETVIRVVTTSNIIADWARIVGGDRVEVISLMPVDVDPHTFQPGPRDAAHIAEADVVLAVGLGMEGFWLEDLLKNVARDASIVLALGDRIDPIHAHAEDEHDAEEDGHEDDEDHEHDEDGEDHKDDEEDGHDDDDQHEDDEDHEHDEDEDEHADDEENGHDEEDDEHADGEDHEHDEDEDEHADADDDHADEQDGHAHMHGPENPHFWFDPIRVKVAINAIAAQFSKLDPANANVYFTNAAAYSEELDDLHHWIEHEVSAVAPERRLLVTSHDSHRYFADRYGFEVIGVILGVTTDVEASAEHLAELVELIREHDVPAVFGETITSERLAQSLANETGAKLVRLYSDSLGAEGSGADSYIGMVRENVKRVVEALQ